MRLNILAFAVGILCLQMQPELPAGYGWLAAGGLLVLPRVDRRTALTRALAVLGCLALGFTWAAWRADGRLADELITDWEGRDLTLVGVVAGLPQEFAGGIRFEFAVERVEDGAVVPERILLSWYAGRRDSARPAPPAVRPGERWRLTVRLKKPHGNANPGVFDYEAWLLERNIRATGYVRPDPPERLSEMVWRTDYGIERWRLAIRDNFTARLPEATYPYAGVLVALAIGDQKAVQGDLWTTFNRTGTTHLMSISGLHVTMVAALFAWLVSAGWRRVPALALRWPAQKAAVLAGCGAALVYALLAGFAVPAQRTLYMLLVAGAALLSGRLVAPSRILALALLAVLLLDPWAVLAAGFWLSFGAVGALLYVSASRLGEAAGWREKLRGWGIVQWAATLASLPVLLVVFQQFSLVSPLANAIAIPLISFIVTPLALLGAFLPWWPILALAHGVLNGLMMFLVWCAAWPVWTAPAPPLWAALAAGVGVAVCLLPRGVPGRWLGALLIVPAVFWPVDKPPAGTAWVTVLDVGQGLASVVRTREHTLIYDPGPLYSAESDAGQRVVLPYLRALGLSDIDLLMVTHRDTDHSGGMAAVLAALRVDKVVSSLNDAVGERCAAGQRWTWDGVDFEVLHPAAEAYAGESKPNHLACVLRVTAGGRRLLLTSDIEAADEAALLARYPDDLSAEVMLAPHHGSKTSSTPAFLQAVGAREVIIPVGYRNRFGHPKPVVVARYEALGQRIWRTDRDGAVLVTLAPAATVVRGWRQEHRRYWHDR